MNAKIKTSERRILEEYMGKGEPIPTDARMISGLITHDNPVTQEQLGQYRPFNRRKAVTADVEVLEEMMKKYKSIPGFLEAGPRQKLAFSPWGKGVKAAVVTTGGLAPGLNSVVHAIAERHLKTYHMLVGTRGGLWGFRDSFKGMAGANPDDLLLTTELTEAWLDRGGSELGAVRYKEPDLTAMAARIAANMERWQYDILYVIGGDGSMRAAHEIAQHARRLIIVGIPKTMDNDLLWVWQSFGHNTAVEGATSFINTLHDEAESTRRVCILQFFGADYGFVAANAALASGHVDLVMIPEVFHDMSGSEAEAAIETYIRYLDTSLSQKKNNPHAVIVLAEGVARCLADLGACLDGAPVDRQGFPAQLQVYLRKCLHNVANDVLDAFVIEPRHYIRAVPANAQDQIYCSRLGALAVDNALAGYTDFMISQWLTEYVLVPLDLVCQGQKRIPTGGIFWKQVVASTGQPII